MRRLLCMAIVAGVCLDGPVAFCGAREPAYELVGKLIVKERGAARRAVILLFSTSTPFSTHTLIDPAGNFKVKRLPAGTYTLVVAIPRAGEVSTTVEIGPSFADARNRVRVEVAFDRESARPDDHGVSAVALSVPENAKSEYRRAVKALGKQDTKKAIAHLKRAVSIAPQFADAWNTLGTVAFQSNRFHDAESCFREALKQDSRAYEPLVNLGGALLSLGRFLEALPVNLQAVRTRPRDPLAHSQLGQSYYQLGQFDPAEAQLKQAKSLDRAHFSFPQIILALIYQQRHDTTAEVAELEEFLKLHPDSRFASAAQKRLHELRAVWDHNKRDDGDGQNRKH
jgi:Flp pilus assembly protein TadD